MSRDNQINTLKKTQNVLVIVWILVAITYILTDPANAFKLGFDWFDQVSCVLIISFFGLEYFIKRS